MEVNFCHTCINSLIMVAIVSLHAHSLHVDSCMDSPVKSPQMPRCTEYIRLSWDLINVQQWRL